MRRRSLWELKWPIIIGAAVAGLAFLQIARVNAPVPVTQTPEVVRTTSGRIINGQLEIGAADYLAYRIDLNHRAKLKGSFRSSDGKRKIAGRVMAAADFENWRNGSEYAALSQTGYVPRGQINLVLEAGTYYLIFDNLASADEKRLIDATFDVD
ncbi:MAG: hypothetical protein ABI539_02395 [Acidobacteriota bacterium]